MVVQKKMIKVFIDPGHGGEDSGAIGPTGVEEKDLNMEMMDLLRLCCLRKGMDVLCSRYGDFNVSERASTQAANAWGADVYTALHCNGFYFPEANGFEVLYWHSSDRAKNLAEFLCASLSSNFPLNSNRGTKARNPGDRGAMVLSATKMPAIIVEPGFVTNPAEEKWLSGFGTQATIAEAIVNAISVSFE